MLGQLGLGPIAADRGHRDVDVDALLAALLGYPVTVDDHSAAVSGREGDVRRRAGRNAHEALVHRAEQLDDRVLGDAGCAERRGHVRLADRSLHGIHQGREVRV